MSTFIRDSTPKSLRMLLDWVDTGQVVLPEFQRDFIWSAPMTAALVVSLANDYPAGSLIAAQNTGGFGARPVSGVPQSRLPDRPNYLLLDGQQRLTLLYQAFYGHGPYRFFVDLCALDEANDIEDEGVVFFVRWDAKRGKEKKLRDELIEFDGQAQCLALPLETLLGAGPTGVEAWMTQASRRESEREQEQALQDWLTQLRVEWIDPMRSYQFPWVELGQDTPNEAICVIFEDMNRRGVRLGAFDLLVARFFLHEVRLRDLWNDAKETYPELGRLRDRPVLPPASGRASLPTGGDSRTRGSR